MRSLTSGSYYIIGIHKLRRHVFLKFLLLSPLLENFGYLFYQPTLKPRGLSKTPIHKSKTPYIEKLFLLPSPMELYYLNVTIEVVS